MLKNIDVDNLRAINDHVRYIDIAIRELTKCIYFWIDGKSNKEMEPAIAKVSQAEADANKIKIKLMKRISEGKTSLHRSDFLRLVLKMDQIPDYIEGGAIRILYLKKCPSKDLGDKIKPLCEAIIKMSTVFKKTIKSIIENPEKTIKYCDEIDQCEEEVDEIFREIEGYLFNTDLEIRFMLQLRNVLSKIEEAADWCHDTADHIRILVAAF
ncbi:MAG: DUF47 family protein [archaeon]|nr:DUF47 family protein [archaeon]